MRIQLIALYIRIDEKNIVIHLQSNNTIEINFDNQGSNPIIYLY